MQVNQLEGSEVRLYLFGFPIMVTLIVLTSMFIGHVITTRSDRPTNVVVTPAVPKIDVNVPQGPAPRVEVTAATPRVDVNVPQAAPPTINVSTPPAVVTVIREGEKVEKPVMTPPVQVKPVVVPMQSPASTLAPDKKVNAAPAFRDDELTLDTLYRYAEKYIESYCRKNGLDVAAEGERWNKKWQRSLDQAMADNTDSGEQSFINRVAVEKRTCFDIEKATPEQVVEGCRIMLRYRDGKLAWLKAMQDAVTSDGLKKTLVFLAAGVNR